MNRYSGASLAVNALTGQRRPVCGTSIRAHLTTTTSTAGPRIDDTDRHSGEGYGLTFFPAAVIVPVWIAG